MELRVGLLGVGTVGGGVAELLLGEGAALKERTGGIGIRLVAAADIEPKRLASLSAAGVEVSKDAMRVVSRDDVDVVVELIGGADTAKALILEALRRRRSVVTANKHLLAEHGEEIVRAARGAGAALGFSAAVCGGVPVLLALRTGLVANKIASIVGIVNGTCNYILTRMSLGGTTYAAALAEAQAQGYAEANPALDVDGHDSAHKLTILAALAFRTPVALSSVLSEGISGLDVLDLRYAQDLGYVVKLVAIGKRAGDRDALDLRVHPTLLPKEHPLAAVSGVFNAVEITGHAVGRVMLFGRGAGKEPTSSNIVADLVEIARGSAARATDQLAFWIDRPPMPILPPGEASTRFYVRFTVRDEYGVLGSMARILGEHRVSIASVIQKEPHEGDATNGVPIVVLTHAARAADFRAALDEIDACEFSIRRAVFLRIEEA
ncbi:MAG: homoserine dehydrogenase [Vicinamibacteria bacterium]|nr:homoserine dehydrogenase [Vicinamibacteria bacterium]